MEKFKNQNLDKEVTLEEFTQQFDFLEKDLFFSVAKQFNKLIEKQNPFIMLIMGEVCFDPEM